MMAADDHLDATETWPPERWQRLQLRRLRGILRHAYDNLPFYQRRFQQAGVHPGNVRSFQDFSRVPILTKAEVLAAVREGGSFAPGMERLEPRRRPALAMTSGTLGTAFHYRPYPFGSWGHRLLRGHWWAGLRPGMRVMVAAPGWHALALVESYVIRRLKATSVTPWGTFLPRFAASYLDAIADLKPDFVSIFLPMLFALLAEARLRGLAPAQAFQGVRRLLVMGAPMTPPFRAGLLKELGVEDIYEIAGNPEGLRAQECSFHRGHHLFVDSCYVEILDPTSWQPLPPGQRGSLILTYLIPHGSVYIRYDTEDLAELLPESCPCGRTWPLIEVYDRRANAFQVGSRELVPYDVRLCVDEIEPLRGTPLAVIRRPGPMPYLRLAISRPPDRGAPLEELQAALKATLERRLQVELREEWVEALPERWKGMAVIEEEEWERV